MTSSGNSSIKSVIKSVSAQFWRARDFFSVVISLELTAHLYLRSDLVVDPPIAHLCRASAE